MVNYLKPDSMQCWLANGQHQSHTKKCLEFENNTISHTTFAGRLTMLTGLTIHVQLALLVCLL